MLRRVITLGVLGALAFLAAGCSVVDLMSGRIAPVAIGDPNSSLTTIELAVVDPYDVPGFWAKAQLHVHTDRSIDGKWPLETALQVYAQKGYDFVVITDHDTVTTPGSVPDGLTVITGEEHTFSQSFYPLGQHILFLFIDRPVRGGSIEAAFFDVANQGGLSVIAHPSWNGFGGYGKWRPWHLLAAPGFHMMEVYNPHSDPDRDTELWHETVRMRGPHNPVWAVAVDDAHDRDGVGRGWIQVKVEGTDPADLRNALLRGSFYATTGVVADFGVDSDGTIWAKAAERAEFLFINASGDLVLRLQNVDVARYSLLGTEGFVRVEIRARGKRAWSQPFWLVTQ